MGVFKKIAGLGSITLADQVVVSGVRFLTTILIGRFCGPDELGVFCVGFTAVVLAGSFVDCLLTKPYSVFIQRRRNENRQRYAGSTLLQLGLLAVLGCAVVAIIAFALRLNPDYEQYWSTIAIVAGIIPFVLAWEYSRRISFAHLHMRHAFVIDAIMGVVQLACLGLLIATESLNSVTAYMALGTASATVGIVWIIRHRGEMEFVRPAWSKLHWIRNWNFGRWLLAAQVVSIAHGYSTTWMLAIFSGPEAIGLFAAAQTIVLLSNPALISIGNLMGPIFAKSYASESLGAFIRLVSRCCLGMVTGTLCFAVVVSLFREQLLNLMFGPKFFGQGNLVILLVSMIVWWGVSIVMSAGLSAINRPQSTFVGAVIGVLVTTISGVPLILQHDSMGGAVALLLGSVATAVTHAATFWIHVRNVSISSELRCAQVKSSSCS